MVIPGGECVPERLAQHEGVGQQPQGAQVRGLRRHHLEQALRRMRRARMESPAPSPGLGPRLLPSTPRIEPRDAHLLHPPLLGTQGVQEAARSHSRKLLPQRVSRARRAHGCMCVPMHGCVCVCLCVCAWVHVCDCAWVHVCVHRCAWMCACMGVCVHTGMCAWVHCVCMDMCVCTHRCAYVGAWVCVYGCIVCAWCMCVCTGVCACVCGFGMIKTFREEADSAMAMVDRTKR